jgi:hypothetical protein
MAVRLAAARGCRHDRIASPDGEWLEDVVAWAGEGMKACREPGEQRVDYGSGRDAPRGRDPIIREDRISPTFAAPRQPGRDLCAKAAA